MALFVQRNEERTALQERLEAELQEKARQRTELTDDPQSIEDMEYLKGTKRTTGLAWVWALIVVMVIGALVVLMLRAGGQI